MEFNLMYLLIAILLSLLILPLFIYVVRSMVVGFRSPFEETSIADKYARFAVLIPARNEEIVIGNLLDSLKKQKYPESFYTVFVLLNNCSDRTGDISSEHGAIVLDCNPASGKGDVLRNAFSQLMPGDQFDAFIIFDADNVVDPSFLVEVNKSYQKGFDAVQGRRVGKNSQDGAISKAYECFYSVQEVLLDHSQNRMGGSAVFNGTGWMISSRILECIGFPVRTMVEDIELSVLLAGKGIPVHYVHAAKAYDEYPNLSAVSMRQLQRWVFGQIQCMRTYTFGLLKDTLKGSKTSLNPLVICISPILAVIALLIVVLLLVLNPVACIRVVLPVLLLLCCMLFLVANMCLSKVGFRRREYLSGTVLFSCAPIIMMPLVIVNLFRKELEWKSIRHYRDITLSDIGGGKDS